MHTPVLLEQLLDAEGRLTFDMAGCAKDMQFNGTVSDIMGTLAAEFRKDKADPITLYLNSNRLLSGIIDYGLATKQDVLQSKRRAELLGLRLAQGRNEEAAILLDKIAKDERFYGAPVVENADTISWRSFDPKIVDSLCARLGERKFNVVVLDGHDAYRPGFLVAAYLGAQPLAVRNAQDSGRDHKPKLLRGERERVAQLCDGKKVLVLGEDVSTGNAVESISNMVQVICHPKRIRTAGCIALIGHPHNVPHYYGKEIYSI